jgi:putative flippase GtrA
MTIIEQFAGREAGPLVQFVKYAIGGGIATAVHIALFHACAWKLFPALQDNDWAVRLFHLKTAPECDSLRARNSAIDNGIAFVFSNLTAYLINIWWVFKPGKHGLLVEIGLFYLVSGVSVAVGTSIMGLLIRRYGMRTTFAFGANLVTALLINYAMRKFVIFNG